MQLFTESTAVTLNPNGSELEVAMVRRVYANNKPDDFEVVLMLSGGPGDFIANTIRSFTRRDDALAYAKACARSGRVLVPNEKGEWL